MSEEKVLLYLCDVCDKKAGVVWVVRKNGKVINECQKCHYKKNDTKPDTKN